MFEAVLLGFASEHTKTLESVVSEVIKAEEVECSALASSGGICLSGFGDVGTLESLLEVELVSLEAAVLIIDLVAGLVMDMSPLK